MYRLAIALCLLTLTATPLRAGERRTVDFTVRDLRGKFLRLSDFKDQVVEIAFWATFCKSCQKKLRHLDTLYRKHRDRGYVVLGVSVDGPETQSKVRPMTRSYKLSFPVVIDAESAISKLFNPKRSTPFSVFLKGGKRVKVREGFQASDVAGAERELLELLR